MIMIIVIMIMIIIMTIINCVSMTKYVQLSWLYLTHLCLENWNAHLQITTEMVTKTLSTCCNLFCPPWGMKSKRILSMYLDISRSHAYHSKNSSQQMKD